MKLLGRRGAELELKDQLRILPGQVIDHGRYEAGRHWLGAADAHLARIGVAEELDVPHALLELVEHRNAALEERAAINRRLNAVRAAIEKLHAERVLEIGDRS